ncbi:hypothetical protein HG535_0G02530 [Zygotorulaspora mrakii]|uniref:DUF4187 domain-containing protein n=1 Tax=Zygotorulaspora mrakii TaxID=42260 RepID=A0A7H9B8P9_ZYGMR|nr:uncharacterized protein HG535_0G02530 [Zygotorulaspora mrakii]QLG74369.1 hypothetical protein HG535_0G02530 [Zygotorulaspora mrakii]
MSKKRPSKDLEDFESLKNRLTKKHLKRSENGSSDHSRIGNSDHQSEAGTEEEKGAESTTEAGAGRSVNSSFSDGRRWQNRSWKHFAFGGKAVNPLEVDAKEDLPKIMPRGFQIMANMGYKVDDSLDITLKLARMPDFSLRSQSRKGLRGNETVEHRNRLSSNKMTNKKIGILQSLQEIAFEMTGDMNIYAPGQDPRDFNVLWRSYVRQLNGYIVKKPIITEPDTEEELRLEEVHEIDGHLKIISTEEGEEAEEDVSVDDQNNRISSLEVEFLPDDYDGEDEELDLFLHLDIDEQIMKIHIFLRSELYYCFYCGKKYQSDQEMFENCPGIIEDDHK